MTIHNRIRLNLISFCIYVVNNWRFSIYVFWWLYLIFRLEPWCLRMMKFYILFYCFSISCLFLPVYTYVFFPDMKTKNKAKCKPGSQLPLGIDCAVSSDGVSEGIAIASANVDTAASDQHPLLVNLTAAHGACFFYAVVYFYMHVCYLLIFFLCSC